MTEDAEERAGESTTLEVALVAGEESGFHEFDVEEFLNRARGAR